MARSPSRFLYAHKILFSIVLFFSTLFILPFFLWHFNSDRPLSVAVIDKTTGADYREHRSFFWLLHHWKIVDPKSGLYYDDQKDYYGFFPHDSSYSDPADLDLTGRDLLYITDTYGVYKYPIPYIDFEKEISDRHIPSKLIYGGMDESEIEKIEQFDSSGGTIIAEFNTLQNPQQRNPGVLRRLEKLFGVRNTGTLGRYYRNLNTAPKWIKNAFEEQQDKKWEFSGTGIIITLENKRYYEHPTVIVLDASDLAYSPVLIRPTEHWSVRHVSDEVPYFYFFEIMEVDSLAAVAAYFEIRCTNSGREKLERDSIPYIFPAVVVSGAENRKFYFTGDFAENDVDTFLKRYWNVEIIFGRLYSFYFISDQTRFFWRFYLPMMKEILDVRLEQKRIHSK